MTTIQFGRGPQKDPLLAQASELPKDIAPARDLWPAIEASLDAQPRATPRRFAWPMALAAGFLVAAVSALLTWSLVRNPDAPDASSVIASRSATDAALMPVNYGPNSALGAVQLKARDELLAQFRTRLAALSPATRETVVKNLGIIQHAADEIGAALAKDPASGLLNGLLLNAYRQELQIYSTVVTSGDDLTRST